MALLFFSNCSSFFVKTWNPPSKVGDIQKIRVLIDTTGSKIVLKTSGIFTVYDINNLVIKKGIDSIIIDPGSLKARIRVVSEKDFFVYKGNQYRGQFVLFPAANDKAEIIDVVNLEDYLYSVVPSEMPASWPLEALKAQAVCARTYAVKEILHNRKNHYDIKSDTSSQVYSGIAREHDKSGQAVNETKGILATYDGEPIQSFFHSNSGGITEKPENLWGSKIPYLKSVKSPYCKEGKNYAWKFVLPQASADSKFARYAVGTVQNIQVLGRTSSDRVDLIEITGSRKTVRIKGKEFRDIVGAGTVKSLRFGIKKDLNGFYVKGLGFGHGIGLSQWGSYSMAKDDQDFKNILKFYFKGISLARIGN